MSQQAFIPADNPSQVDPDQLEAQAPAQPTSTILTLSSHPVILAIHLLFKILPVIIYVLGSWIIDRFILNFLLCIVFLAMDFWWMKNISGRLLIGLRWWNLVKEDGSNEWIFESREAGDVINQSDRRVFWTSLYGSVAVWVGLGFIAFIKLNFQWLPVVVVAISLLSANLIGYMKCDSNAKKKLPATSSKGFLSNFSENLVINSVTQSVKSMLGGR